MSHCADCGMSTLDERFMLRSYLWARIAGWRDVTEIDVIGPGSIHLCVGCAEERLGRELVADDFKPCPLNWSRDYERSERLRQRLGVTD